MPYAQSRKRILQLLRQYPFLKEVKDYERFAKTRGCEFSVVIKVKRGDPNLMFRQAEDVDGSRGRSIGDPENPDLRGTCLEYYRPVNRNARLGEMHTRYGWENQYVRDLFNRECYDWHMAGEDSFEVVDSIVWIMKETWYPKDTNLENLSDRDKPVRINLRVTVYKEPKKGWQELYRIADPLVNVKLYGWRLMNGPRLRDPFREAIYKRLDGLTWEFQRKVWNTGIGKIVDDSQMKGMSGQYGTVKVMTYVIAGRLRVQFERDGIMLNLTGLDEENPRLGFGSIEGTVPQAEKMVLDVIEFWEKADDKTRQSVHQDDDNVGVGL